MNQKSTNECVGGPKLIFACSGAADVGEISTVQPGICPGTALGKCSVWPELRDVSRAL